MGNNMCPSTNAVGEENTYFVSDRCKFIGNDKIEEGTFLNATNDKLDAFLYHPEKCDVVSLKTSERSQIHSFYCDCEEDGEDEVERYVSIEEDEELIETSYCKGNIEVVKIVNQKCVVCYEKDNDNAFRQCGYQCVCEHCYQNKVNIDILNCVFCRI